MPIRADLRHFYGHHWRAVIRPAILRRAGGSFNERGRYVGLAACERCKCIDYFDRRGNSRVEIAHLDGIAGHDSDENLAALCIRCHHAHDYPAWAKATRETRLTRKDRSRPLLQEIA